MTILVRISLVEGSLLEYERPDSFETRYHSLSATLDGRALVNALWSDDWAAPPRSLEMWKDGELIARIHCESNWR